MVKAICLTLPRQNIRLLIIRPIMNAEDFKDIAPYPQSLFKEKINELVEEPGFIRAIKYVLPEEAIPAVLSEMKNISSTDEFQQKIMLPFLDMLAKKTTAGISATGMDNCNKEVNYAYMSNHRDIVLDASFLNVCLTDNDFPSCEIALGDNLLIYPWIEKLVKLNKGFIVKRNLRLIQAFEAAKQLSGYIRYCIDTQHHSIWIAQREGRAKDSSDRTQESVVKMLALSGGKDVIATILDLNICPVTISYELDPNDYLKAQEFLLREKDPDFQKSQHDDLLSMETGLLGYKGRVHVHLSGSINDEIALLDPEMDRTEIFPRICNIIDNKIHRGYKIFPINYICFDRINNTDRFKGKYTSDDIEAVDKYIENQLKKVRLEHPTEADFAFMREKMMVMYSNPLNNLLQATETKRLMLMFKG